MPPRPRAMILAAGGGTRLHPLTFSLAKPMAPVLNRPVMEHILVLLRRHGIIEIIANLHHRGDQISRYFGDGARLGVSLDYSREAELLGTAGGVKNVARFFGGKSFFVIGGDDLADFDLTAMIEFHRKQQAVATIAVSPVEDVAQFGIVVADERGRIQSFQEKPKPEEARSRLANTGVYLFEPEALDFIPARQFYDFGKQVFPLLLERGAPFYAWPAAGYWKDIGSPRQYLEANLDALAGRAGVQAAGDEVSSGVWHDGKVGISGAVVEPPALLGRGCVLDPGCSVTASVIGPRARVSAGARLDKCVVWAGVKVGDVQAESAILTRGRVVWV